jgi:HNH endonuclease
MRIYANEQSVINAEKKLEVAKKWGKDNRQRKTEYEREWNKEKGKYRKDYQKNWRKNNRNKLKEYNYKRMQKDHNITKIEWESCLSFFNQSCAYCGMTEVDSRKIYNQRLHKEHVIHDGRNDLKNCIPACKSCNSSKREYTLNHWYNSSNPVYTREKYLHIVLWMKTECKKHKEQI